MIRDRRWIIVGPMIAVLMLSACGEPPSDEHVINEPVKVEPVKGTDLARLTLTERAAERLGIETAPVEGEGNRKVVPADAVFYDVNGKAWVYTNPEPFVFMRGAIDIDRFRGRVAILSEGPPAGTEVVTVAVPALIGSEFGV